MSIIIYRFTIISEHGLKLAKSTQEERFNL